MLIETTFQNLVSQLKLSDESLHAKFSKDMLDNKEAVCLYICSMLFFTKVVIFLDDLSTFNEFSNWLKINYNDFYGWRKIQQICLDNREQFSNYLIKQIESSTFPSTFEIPSNWIIYAPISR